MIFHSDLGSQYTSKEYEKKLLENNVRHSYSKKGYPYGNNTRIHSTLDYRTPSEKYNEYIKNIV